MDIRKVHILVEQGLQQVGVFAYDDFLHEEIDLQIDKAVYRILKSAFNPIQANNSFQYNQGVLDRIRVLQETDVLLNSSKFPQSGYIQAPLPEDYIHYIRSISLVETSTCCGSSHCTCIDEGKFYKVLTGAIIYNNIEYREGDVFQGVEGKQVYSELPSEDEIKVVDFSPKRSSNRIIESDKVYEVLSNGLSKTISRSPVGEIGKDFIRIYYSNFVVNNLLFSYIRTPEPVNFNFKRLSSSDELEQGIEYEVLTGTINYAGSQYSAKQTFIATSSTFFSGTGIVKKYLEGDLNLPEQVCYDVINEVVEQLSVLSEQNQQKINNLTVKDNVPS